MRLQGTKLATGKKGSTAAATGAAAAKKDEPEVDQLETVYVYVAVMGSTVNAIFYVFNLISPYFCENLRTKVDLVTTNICALPTVCV